MSRSHDWPERFSLSAGGLFGLAQRWIRGPESPEFHIATQITIVIVFLWLPLILLSFFAGSLTGVKVEQPLVSDVVPHVRLLVAIPLLLLADLAIDPATRTATRSLTASGIVPDDELSRFHGAQSRMRRATKSVWPDIVIVILAFSFIWLFKPGYGESALQAAATSWAWSVDDGHVRYSLAGWWYLLVSGPMFQVVLFRWFWRFLVWAVFLFQVSRLSLTLLPTHPDLAGGLGYLGVAQQTFAAVFFAFATVASSTIAHDILAEGASLVDVRLEITVLVLGFVAIIYAPLLLFSKQMVTARKAGLDEYGAIGYLLAEAFHNAWVREGNGELGKELLASTDSSTMADYSATYDNVRSMRFVPATPRGVLMVAGILAVPFVPLEFTEFSIQELLDRLADALV